jgi:hypothetical protein
MTRDGCRQAEVSSRTRPREPAGTYACAFASPSLVIAKAVLEFDLDRLVVLQDGTAGR